MRNDVLVEALGDLAIHGRNYDEKTPDDVLKKSWGKFDTIFHLMLICDMFDMTTPLSKTWQCEDLDLAAAVKMAQETIALLEERCKEDKHFQAIWKEVQEFSTARNIMQISAQTGRKKQPSSRLLDFFPFGNNRSKVNC